jgi:hypothetical protein
MQLQLECPFRKTLYIYSHDHIESLSHRVPVKVDIVGCRLKAGMSELERMSTVRQRLGNHISCIIAWVTNTFTWQHVHNRSLPQK